MSYSEQQKQWLKANNIKVGSKVKIAATLKEGKDGKKFGWAVHWSPSMSENKDKIGTVVNIDSDTGIKVEIQGSEDFWYPYFVLETVGDLQLESAIAEFQQQHA